MRLKTVPLSSRSTHALVSITPNFSLLYLFYYYDSCDPVLLQLASEHFRSLMFLCVFIISAPCPGHDNPVSGSPGRDPKYIHRVREIERHRDPLQQGEGQRPLSHFRRPPSAATYLSSADTSCAALPAFLWSWEFPERGRKQSKG